MKIVGLGLLEKYGVDNVIIDGDDTEVIDMSPVLMMYDANDFIHGIPHIANTVISLQAVLTKDFNLDLVSMNDNYSYGETVIAAIMHDIGRTEETDPALAVTSGAGEHDIRGVEIFNTIILKMVPGLAKYKDSIVDAIQTHRLSNDKYPTTTVGKLVYDADKISIDPSMIFKRSMYGVLKHIECPTKEQVLKDSLQRSIDRVSKTHAQGLFSTGGKRMLLAANRYNVFIEQLLQEDGVSMVLQEVLVDSKFLQDAYVDWITHGQR